MNAQDILNTLKTGHHLVTFRKADGTLRTMQGYAMADTTIRTDGIVPILEMGTGAYKSFKIENLVSINPLLDGYM